MPRGKSRGVGQVFPSVGQGVIAQFLPVHGKVAHDGKGPMFMHR